MITSEPAKTHPTWAPGPLRGRDFLTTADFSVDEHRIILDTARAMKSGAYRPRSLEGKNLAMIFEKPSLRTRTTFEVGMEQLGGHAVYLPSNEIGLGTREPVRDIALNLERWVEGIMARVYLHSTLEELANYAKVPVINGLSDLLHPVQLLADYLTIEESFGSAAGLKIAFVGDGNNMANAHVQSAAVHGCQLTVATPRGYEPNAAIMLNAMARGADVTLTNDPLEAVKDAAVVYTDVWVSMGQETEASQKRKLRDFQGFQVTPAMLDLASPDGIFLHCLPAHYGEEVVEEATMHPKSRVFDQAENRLHAQKALLHHLLG